MCAPIVSSFCKVRVLFDGSEIAADQLKPVTAASKGALRSFSLAKLRKYANAYNIGLDHAVEKDDVIDTLLTARVRTGTLKLTIILLALVTASKWLLKSSSRGTTFPALRRLTRVKSGSLPCLVSLASSSWSSETSHATDPSFTHNAPPEMLNTHLILPLAILSAIFSS